MKGKNTYLMPIVLLLCVVFSGVILAEERDTGRGIMSEISRDRDKYKKRDRRRDLWTKDSIHQKHFQENSIANTSGTWVTTTVDSGEYVGRYSSIAIDSRDKVHISYYYSGDLKYATNASGAWVTTTVDSGVDVGEYNSIAIDSRDKVHISYFDDGNKDLKYATNASGAWVRKTLDGFSLFHVGEYNSLAIDSKDKVHISYYAFSYDGLRYASNATGDWVMTRVDGSNRADTSLAIDASDKVHISYQSNNDLKYATNASGSWKKTTVDDMDTAGYINEYSSIAIDSRDKVHISYYSGDLKYATNASGAWVTTTVDSDGDVGEYNSIAIDSKDKEHISYYYYYDVFQAELKYATNAFQSPTPTPSPQPTTTVTPGPTPTPIPSCEPENMIADPKNTKVSIDSNAQATITITCEDDSFFEGEKVAWKIKKGKKNISITPKSATTDVNGQAVFTIAGVKRGKAKVEFKSGDLKTKVKVTVTE